jgi:tetrapyrrole methylase family protein/MazG family protein/ATP diphosphatase
MLERRASVSRIDRLVEIMAKLRDPNGGCPWDLEQDFASIAPYTLEEAYEVDDAIRRGDMKGLCDELGDLLLQVVFHARMAEEAEHFRFEDVVEAICEKLVRRHPHVFGDAAIATSAEQTESWEAIKAAERAEAGRADGPLDDVPLALPALARAAKLQRRAARAGRATELPDAGGETLDAAALGERLFALVALASRAGLDPEQALRDENARFVARASGDVRQNVKSSKRGS